MFYSEQTVVLSESVIEGDITFFIVIHLVNCIKNFRQNRNRWHYRPSWWSCSERAVSFFTRRAVL